MFTKVCFITQQKCSKTKRLKFEGWSPRHGPKHFQTKIKARRNVNRANERYGAKARSNLKGKLETNGKIQMKLRNMWQKIERKCRNNLQNQKHKKKALKACVSTSASEEEAKIQTQRLNFAWEKATNLGVFIRLTSFSYSSTQAGHSISIFLFLRLQKENRAKTKD